jgi:hypothetical protein
MTGLNNLVPDTTEFTALERELGWAIRPAPEEGCVALYIAPGVYHCHLPSDLSRLVELDRTIRRYIVTRSNPDNEPRSLPTDREIKAGLNDPSVPIEEYLTNLERGQLDGW